MFNYIEEKLPSSFSGIFVSFVEPYKTQSFKLEFVNNKYFKPFFKNISYKNLE